jgi:uncharacterized protein with PQ loop repeat
MPFASLIGWGGGLLGLVMTFLQAIRVHRLGPDGVSATTWSLFTLMAMYWLSYGLAAHSAQVIVGTAAGVPLMVWLLAMVEPTDLRRGLARGTAAIVATTWIPALLFGWDAGLLGIGVLMVATRFPQLLELVRADHARGVSTGSWVMGSVSVTMWLCYYAISNMSAAAISMAFALGMNLAIVAMAVARHRGEVVPRGQVDPVAQLVSPA